MEHTETPKTTFRRIATGTYETQDGRYQIKSAKVGSHARSSGRTVWFITDTQNPDRRFMSSESLSEARWDVADIIRQEN